MIRALFRIEWQQLRNTWITGGAKNLITLIISAIISVGILYALTSSAVFLGLSVESANVAPVMSIFLLIGLLIIFLFGIPQVFQQLYSATDLETLFTMPISTRGIFLVKYIQSFLGIPGIIWLILFIPLTGFGIGAGYSWLYYPVLFLVTIGITVIGVSLVYLVNLGLVQIFPAHRANELMIAMTAIAMMLFYILLQIPNMAGGWDFSAERLTSFSEMPGWLPTTLGAAGLSLAAQGKWGAWLPVVIVVLVAAFFVLFSSGLVEKGFRRGWVRLSEGRRKKVKQKKRGTASLRHPVIFLGLKEWHTFKRDMREWVMLLPVLFFLLFPFASLFFYDGGETVLQEASLAIWMFIQFLFLFFFGMISGQLTMASVGREGKASWVLRVLPLSGRQIALGKFWIGWLVPFLALCLIEVVLGVIFAWSWTLILLGIVAFALLSLGINGMALWMGTLAPKYNPNNPQDRVQIGARFLSMLLHLVYMVIAFIPGVIILFPVQFEPVLADIAGSGDSFFHFLVRLFDMVIGAKVDHEVWINSLAVAGLVIFSLGVAVLTLSLAAKRFDKGVHIHIIQSSGGRGLFGSPFSGNKLK